jgi:predicted transcriptional regulator
VWIGRQIKGKDTIDIATLKEKMVNDINYEAEKCPFLNKGKITSFMLNLSCIVPFSKNDSRVIETLSKHFGIDKNSVSRSIDQLLKSGVLREVGKSLRFDPDMKGDLYLAYNLGKDSDDYTIKSLIKTWLPIFAERVLIYGDLSVIREILADIINTWINETDDTSGYERKKRLNLLSKIAPLMPEESLNLIYAYLNSKPPVSKDLGKMAPNLDGYGPTIRELIKIHDIRKDVVELLRDLERRNIQGTYSNDKAKVLMRECISPLYNHRDLIKETLDILSTWLGKDISSFEIGLISEAISEMLAGTHEYTRFVIGRVEFGETARCKISGYSNS